MKKLILITLIISSTYTLSAQTSLEKIGKINAGLQGIDFSYELPVGKKLVWESGAGLGLGMNVDSNKRNYNFYLLDPVPFISTELKWLYNREKRENKEKNNLNNTGDYLGLQTKYSFGMNNAIDLNQTLLTDFHWGIQRNISQKFIFNGNIGIGYMYDFETNYGGIAPILRVKIGYRLF